MRGGKEKRDLKFGDIVETWFTLRKNGESGFIILAGRLLVKIRKALSGHLLGLSLAHAVVFISLELFGSASVQKLQDRGVQNAQIMQISGHKNVQSVNTYSRLNQNQQKTDKILSCFCKSIEMVYLHGRLVEPRMMGLAVGDVVHTQKKRRIRFHHFSWTFTGKYSESIDCRLGQIQITLKK
jgi:hypothetical protein